MQLAVREFIRRYNERSGATVLLTSHYMDDVASLCRRVVVIDHGRLRYDGAPVVLPEEGEDEDWIGPTAEAESALPSPG